MSYKKQIFAIRYGSGGLHTDDPQGLIPPHKLTRAINVNLENGRIKKEGGSIRWNAEAQLPTGVKQFIDWHPDGITQRLIVVGEDGKVYRFKDAYNFSEVTAVGGAPETLNISGTVMIVKGGQEESGNNRKLFIFTGNNPIQVISGDGTTRTDISNGATDWSGNNQPTFGIIHRNRLWAFGNDNDPHRAYASGTTDQEDFTSSPLQFSIYPGVSERLITGIVYKKRLFFMKNPLGAFILDDTSITVANWTISQTHKSFGAASPKSIVPVLDDVLVANSFGSITSVKAAERTDDIVTGDIFSSMRVQDFLDNEINKLGLLTREAIYYADQRVVFITYQSAGNFVVDRICRIDFNRPEPIITWTDKDLPNCLEFIEDIQRVKKPAYGATDGYIYLMDRKDFNVGGSGYRAEFWTPILDFGTANMVTSEQNKNFNHLELIYEPTGEFNLTVDIYIDLILSETVTFDLSGNSELDEMVLDDPIEGRLDPGAQLSQKRQIGGKGRRIQLKCYNEGNGESFTVNGFNIYYSGSSQQQLEK